MSNVFDLIIEEWEINLKNKDKKMQAVESNFEEVLESLHAAGATFEQAHGLLPTISKIHQPPLAIARNIYKSLRKSLKGPPLSEKEYIDSWNKEISDKALSAFYAIFPRPKSKEEEEDEEPKVFGNMSAREYRAQRRHADQYPILNTEELEKRMQTGTYNPMEDIANILGQQPKGDENVTNK